MLKRINEIKTVGCFINERAASLQFEKLTFVYGENCYGKSTLCDIFRSLAENNPNLITKRLTVPNPNSENQIVNFNFTFPTTESETPFIFRNNAWESTLPDCPILVFDTDFIHRNVFTGLTIERRNEENITQFVLGESSVEIARQISLLNSTLRQINRDIREIESSSLNNITDIPAFVSLIVSESQETYSEQISTIGVELQQQRQLAENINSTISRSEPNRLREIPDINQFISRFNECISSSLQRIHENATERVLEHIRTHCQDSPIAENWLRTGINLLNESTCPFCGQQFSQDAINLIQNYREHFNDAFDQFERQIIQQIDQLIRELSNFQMLDLLELIQTNRDSLNAYPELLNSQRFSQELGRLNSEVSQFTLVLREWRQLYEHFSSQIFEALRLKRENIFRALETIDLSNLNFKYQAIIQYIDRYNQIIQSLVNYISEFKRGLTPQKINQAILTLEVQQADTNRRLARIQLNGVCTRYNSLISQRTETSDRIAELNEELDLYQADYLDNYFEKINSLFSQLVSY